MSPVDESLISKFGLPAGSPKGSPLDELDLRPPEYKAYGIDPQARPSNAMLDFWLVSGNERAFAYTHLYDADFNPSLGIVLTFSDHQVTVHGRHLRELYRAIKRHRVVYVWEADEPTVRLLPASVPVVTRILIQSQREILAASQQ